MKNLFVFCLLTLVFMSKQSLSYSQGYLKYEFTSAAPSEEIMQERIEQIKTQIPDEALQEQVIEKLREKMIQNYQINLVFEGEVAVSQNESIKNSTFKIGEEIVYRNTSESVFIAQNYILNKAFVVNDSLPVYEVVYTEETKQIGTFQSLQSDFETKQGRSSSGVVHKRNTLCTLASQNVYKGRISIRNFEKRWSKSSF